MKIAVLVFAVLLGSTAYSQTIDSSTQGTCSPDIIENKGEVRFTCQAVLDPTTAKKLNQVLNELLLKGKQSSNISAKLDEILAFIHKQAPRSFTDTQRQNFLNAVGTVDKGAIRIFLVGSDSESFTFSRQVGDMLTAGGWHVEYRQGIVVNADPSGIKMSVINQNVPYGAILQQALKLVGVDAPAVLAPTQDVPTVLQIGPKPMTQ